MLIQQAHWTGAHGAIGKLVEANNDTAMEPNGAMYGEQPNSRKKN
jgi:hypothetical protein